MQTELLAQTFLKPFKIYCSKLRTELMSVYNHLLSDSGEHQEHFLLADASLLEIHCKDSENPEKKNHRKTTSF